MLFRSLSIKSYMYDLMLSVYKGHKIVHIFSLLFFFTSEVRNTNRTFILRFIEIGRASCREKSVDLGGRRIIKKKKKKINQNSHVSSETDIKYLFFHDSSTSLLNDKINDYMHQHIKRLLLHYAR